MKKWYVIRTKPKREKAVFLMLSRCGHELFLPMIQGVTQKKPLFPAYLFVYTDLQESAHRLIRYTRGVSCILGDEEGPQPINDNIIEELRQWTQDGALMEQELLFQKGESVRVRKGILKDLTGIIERHLSDEKRVQILFKWWSTSMRVKLPCQYLEKVA